MGKREQISSTSDTARLMVAVGLSVSVHLLLALAWWIHPPAFSQTDNTNQAKPAVHFGIDQSHHQTIAWLGFIDPTPQQAPEAAVDQSSLSPQASPAQALEAQVPDSSAAGDAALARVVELGSAAQASFGQLAIASQKSFLTLMESVAQAAANAQSEPEASDNPKESTPGDGTAIAEKPTETETEAEAADPSEAGPNAIESEKEADATSREKPLEYRNGKVASREGLDIKTVRPKWNDITLLTSNPRNPIVQVEFASDGTIKLAKFEQGGTGFESVDQTLLNAIYAWTASGKEIDDLKETNPKGVVTARIRIRLR